MKKFQDEFSSSSYEELLKKYGGESDKGKDTENPVQKSPVQTTNNQNRDVNSSQKPAAPRTNYGTYGANNTQRTTPTTNHSDKTQDNSHTRSFDLDMLTKFEKPSQRQTKSTTNNHSSSPKKEKFVVNISQAKNLASGVASKVKNVASNVKTNISSKPGNGTSANNAKDTAKKIADELGKVAGRAANTISNNKTAFITIVSCLLISIILSSCILSCVNDVLAINRKGEETIEVTLPENVDTYEAIRILDDAGLIKNTLFCNAFVKLMGFTDENYLPGIYYFTDDMGVEKMLTRFKTSGTRGNIISITIPEGYTIDQIIQRLDKNKVCSADSLYKVLESVDFGNEYDFIAKLENTDDRYNVLEGYLFPATYEFEQGSEPAAVIRKLLDKFKSVWDEERAAKATELGMSVDEIITLASIIEKEGTDKEQFIQISSVLHNRLNNPGVYPTLECDSTKDYVKNTIAKRASSPALKKFIITYSTYDSAGLPPSAISNPGAEAIDAALNPANTQYYFFRHDNKGKIYLAKTVEEHNANGRLVDRANAEA